MTSGRQTAAITLAYLAIAYGWSWLFWTPEVLAAIGVGTLDPWLTYLAGFVAPFGPVIAAAIVTAAAEGRRGVADLGRRSTRLAFPARWLLPTLLLVPAWAFIALLVGVIAGTGPVDLPWLADPPSLIVGFGTANFAYMLLFAGIAEEPGWRGLLLERLQERYSAAAASVLVGVAWAFWHLPLVLIPGSPQARAGFAPFLLQMVFFSFVMAWLYNNTRRSVLVAILFHAVMNTTLLVALPIASLFPADSPPVLFLYASGAAGVVAVLAWWGPSTLVRTGERAG